MSNMRPRRSYSGCGGDLGPLGGSATCPRKGALALLTHVRRRAASGSMYKPQQENLPAELRLVSYRPLARVQLYSFECVAPGAWLTIYSRALFYEKHCSHGGRRGRGAAPRDAPDAAASLAAQLAASAVSAAETRRGRGRRARPQQAPRQGADGRGVFKATPPAAALGGAARTSPNENVTRSLWAAPEPQPRHELAVQLRPPRRNARPG